MISQLFTDTGVVVVLADANVLYSRVPRDYLLYAADQEIISITWSATILREVTRNLAEKRPGFSVESGERLVAAMNDAFPLAEFEPDSRRGADPRAVYNTFSPGGEKVAAMTNAYDITATPLGGRPAARHRRRNAELSTGQPRPCATT